MYSLCKTEFNKFIELKEFDSLYIFYISSNCIGLKYEIKYEQKKKGRKKKMQPSEKRPSRRHLIH